MIRPYGKNLLVRLIEPEKKKGFLIVNEEPDPIARCEYIDAAVDASSIYNTRVVLLFRRYELRDCVDKEKKLYIVKEECLLGYEDDDGQKDAVPGGEAVKES